MAFTTSRPPFTRLTTPGGSRSVSSIAKTFCMVSGTRSDGFSTTVLPHAMAYGRNQNGIIAGKVERRDDGAHAERLADHHFVDAGGDVFGVVALHQDRGAAGDLDVLDRRGAVRRATPRGSCRTRA